jgi:nucleoside-diphosphate-sugar epimerase
MSLITVLGGSGFIGSHLIRRAAALNLDHHAPGRGEDLSRRPLGHVIYCIGLTADFRVRPFDTVEAHVWVLHRILRECRYDSLTYLSSTRLYGSHAATAGEEDAIHVRPLEPGDLYNVSKAMGESLCLTCEPKARVARISNVYGCDFESENFLAAVIGQAVSAGKVVLQTSLDSEKDYVSIDDVTDLLLKIAADGRHRIYNVASGRNVSNGTLMARVAELSGCDVEVAPQAKTIRFPRIGIERIRDEFGFSPADMMDDIGGLLTSYERRQVRSE